MTTYYSISSFPSALYSRLQYIETTYGVKPTDPAKSGYSSGESRYTSAFGMLYVLTGDSTMKTLYETHRDYISDNLDRGYLTAKGSYSPTEADQEWVPSLFEIYRNEKDENLFDLLNTISSGFAGIRKGYNWPTYEKDRPLSYILGGTWGYTVFYNTLNGSWWGTVNQTATSMLILLNAYHTSGMDCYHLSSIPERIWNLIKFIEWTQNSDGSFPRDKTGVYYELYDLFTVSRLAQSYILLDSYGDITYNGDSIKSIIKSILDNHWVFYQSKYGTRVVTTESMGGTLFAHCYELYVQGYGESAIKTAMMAAFKWIDDTGTFYLIDSSDERIKPVAMMNEIGWFGDSNLKNLFKRWS